MSPVATRSIAAPSSPVIKRILKACGDAGFSPKSVRFSRQGDMTLFFKDNVADIEMKYNEWDEKWSMKDE